jgi:hypothetical protein
MDIPPAEAHPNDLPQSYEHLNDSPHPQQATAELLLHGLYCSGVCITGSLLVFFAVLARGEFQQVDHDQRFVVSMAQEFLYLFTSRGQGFYAFLRIYLYQYCLCCAVVFLSMFSSMRKIPSGRALLQGEKNLIS